MKKITLLTIALFSLAACETDAGRGYGFTRPESLLDISAERVTFALSGFSAKQDVNEWVMKDRPARAELSCESRDATCAGVAANLKQIGVPYTSTTPADGQAKAVLVYERIIARACDPRYKNDSFNNLNRPHAALGCATSSNIIQQVSDPVQFTAPAMLGDADGEKAAATYKKYQMGKPAKPMAPPPPAR